MKKLVYTLMFLVGFAGVSFAQEATEIAVTQGAATLEKSKVSGEYAFTVTGKTEADISAAATYYAQYFTVVFNEATQTVKIEMIENTERSRPVIMRFLVASGIRYTTVDGKVISINDFMSDYLL